MKMYNKLPVPVLILMMNKKRHGVIVSKLRRCIVVIKTVLSSGFTFLVLAYQELPKIDGTVLTVGNYL